MVYLKVKSFLVLSIILSNSAYAQVTIMSSQRAYTSRDASVETELLLRQYYVNNKVYMRNSWHVCSHIEDKKKQVEFNKFCDSKLHLGYQDSSSLFDFSPLLEFSYRGDEKLDTDVQGWTYGGQIKGRNNYLSFWVDARIYAETHSRQKDLDRAQLSWDREFIDIQDDDRKSVSNNISFVSFARYRANLNIDTDIGQFGFKRETVHWGPGVYSNLVFNHQAVPFNHIYYQAEIGPFRVWTLWGRLLRSTNGEYQIGTDTKSVYAHRYEWSALSNLTIGMTEQMVLFNTEEPWAFIPIVPLFMEKGQGVEQSNNGNLAFDISYRIPNWSLLYTEFLIDDLQEPSTLFDDYWGNRWAWMAGLHLSPGLFKGAGLIAEYSRVEPWVYTHYDSLTSQASNGGDPLGNQFGPNSQSIILQPYYSTVLFRESSHQNTLFFGLKALWLWKGSNAGSEINDGNDKRFTEVAAGEIEPYQKEFLRGAKLEMSFGPVIRWRGYGFQADLEADYFGNNDHLLVRIGYQY